MTTEQYTKLGMLTAQIAQLPDNIGGVKITMHPEVASSAQMAMGMEWYALLAELHPTANRSIKVGNVYLEHENKGQ